MNKIIFLDIDGTIRNFDGVIPDSAVRAIRTARENGHKVCISTGRPLCQIEPRVLEIGFDGVISCAGAYVTYEEKCVHHESFKGARARELMEYMVREGCLLEFQRNDTSQVLAETMPGYMALQEQMLAMMRKFMPPGKEPKKLVENLTEAQSIDELGEVEKILYFSDHVTPALLQEQYGDVASIVTLSIPAPNLTGGELTPAAVDKAEGIRAILSASGFTEADVIAVGDSANDIAMIRMAAVGVAMGNATPEAKAAADLITTPLLEDGIWNAFQTLKLI